MHTSSGFYESIIYTFTHELNAKHQILPKKSLIIDSMHPQCINDMDSL